MKLFSSDHGTFGEHNLVVDAASLESVFGAPLSGQFLPPVRASQIMRSYLLSIFNKFLKSEDDHLLDGRSPDHIGEAGRLAISN